MILGQDLAYGVRGRAILDGVDLSLASGELVGLIGPNGAGKTTLLRAIAGLLQPNRGQILYDGRTLRDIGRGGLACQVAYLAQAPDVHWALEVERIVALGRLPHGRSVRDGEVVERAMDAVSVTPLRARRITTLSGGERTRVLIARALAVEAPFLLADEPTAALDPYYQLQVMELLAGLAEKGLGIAVVLHDLTLAARFCRRLILLDEGRLLAEGAPASVLSNDNLRRAYRIEAVSQERDGQRLVLPWRRTGPDRHPPHEGETRP